MKRRSMSSAHSKHNFTKHAMKTHRKNVPGNRRMIMRGGIRL